MTQSVLPATTATSQNPSFSSIPSFAGGSGQALPACSSGLVYSQTSHRRLEVNPKQTRIDRMQRGVKTAARLHKDMATKGGKRFKPALLTLTYRDGADYSPKHISVLFQKIRQYCKRSGKDCRYVWVMELTKAGVPHYHIVFWMPWGFSLPKPDKQGWWPHGMTRIEWARNGVAYIAKYASKGDADSKFPKGARIHGHGGLDAVSCNERTWWLCPAWVRKRWERPEDRPRRAKGGGWYSVLTGEWEPSPWLVEFKGGRVFISLRDIPEGGLVCGGA